MSSHKKPACILHVSGKITADVKYFDEDSWNKVKTADEQRHQLLKNSKYFTVKLPDEYDETIGYHVECYKNFTAVRHNPVGESGTATPKQHVLRSDMQPSSSTSSSGIFLEKCLFCNSVRKSQGGGKIEHLGSCEMDSGAENIRKAALALNDDVMLAKIAGVDFFAKEVKYHHSCRKAYLNRAQRADLSKCKQKSAKTSRHDEAFEGLKSYICVTLVENEGAELLTSLHTRYMNNLDSENSNYSAQTLCEKILKEFPDKLRKTKTSNRKGIVIYNSQLTEETAIRRADFDQYSIKEAAFYLRTLIMRMINVAEDLPEHLTAETLATGQGKTPQPLLDFFTVLYSGSSSPTDKIQQLVKSVADDVVFVTTRGRIKPGKHLCMGLGLKSMTGSRQVIELANRFGHSISYHTAESLETSLATEITERNCASPDGFHRFPGLGTALAWDNYDENLETLSGSGTLHDTVGICYQNEVDIPQADAMNDQASNEIRIQTKMTKKAKRVFHMADMALEPYRKKPKISVFEYDVKETTEPKMLRTVEFRDIFWMMNITTSQTPMWTGWNSLITEDKLPKQKIMYMENLNLPPTRLDVVAETLRISQRVAHECQDEFIAVHYDLAVAKPAMQIQVEEAPRFDNIFICFGPFHIAMAYFGALGHILSCSGGPQILTDTEVLAPGSLNAFISGKHYNR